MNILSTVGLYLIISALVQLTMAGAIYLWKVKPNEYKGKFQGKKKV